MTVHQSQSAPIDVLQAEVSDVCRIEHVDDIRWDHHTEVAVVGYGAAGASAALEAASSDTKVTVLDRLNGGGASALSGGVVYAGGGTEFQQQAGEKDSVDNMINYLRQETAEAVSESTLRRFCEESIANLEWLQHHGVPFDSTAYDEKTSYPPEGYFLYYSGNELCAPYRDAATAARRGHRVKGKNFTGRVLFERLHQAILQKNNIRVQAHSEVQRLIVDGDNRVVGLEYLQGPTNGLMRGMMSLLNRFANRFVLLDAHTGSRIRQLVHQLRQQGQRRRLRVTQGVILSAGGFVFNRPLLKQLAAPYRRTRPLGEDCNGSGIALGVSAGGDVAHMERVSAWRFFAPPTCLLKGIIVDDEGQRICNEDLYGATTADRVLAAGGKRAYLILDQQLMNEAKSAAQPGKMPWHHWMPARLFLNASSAKGKDLDELASQCGLDGRTLMSSVSNYNAGAELGQDAFGKAVKYTQALQQGPYYAVDISLNNTKVPCPAITLGGLRVNEESGAVVDSQEHSIEGLYAAGRNAVGICSHSYISGLSLADCVFSGRRAGRSAASVSAAGISEAAANKAQTTGKTQVA